MFAALVASAEIGERTGWSIRKFVRTAHRYRTIEIRGWTTPSLPPPPDDRRKALEAINHAKDSPASG